jgi:uncharacterized protein YndB with AHSA1/START domain/DNA-binding HxlR family transcriptional regulator
MDEYNLSETLKASSDATRRSILTTLVQQGPTRVTELAGRYDISLNSVSKHIKVLEAAGLVTRKTIGRVHLIEANLAPLTAIDDWFKNLKSIWALQLEALDDILTKEPQMPELSLTVSRQINAPIEAVFNAWLSPEMMARFMTPGEGMSVEDAKADPVEGGSFSLNMIAGDKKMPHGGAYKVIKPHSTIVFSWDSPFSVDDTLVTLKFTAKDGGTNIELNHIKFANEEARDNHKGGWTKILESLEAALT